MSSRKPKCEYGQKCYRKNPQHVKKYQHWGTSSRKSSGTSSGRSSGMSNIKRNLKIGIKIFF
jgi:hypothetical protein